MSVAAPSNAPSNLEAEASVLGAVLLSQNALRHLIVEEGLRPEHFHRDRHRVIWQAMTAMSDAQQHVDVLTVTAHLKAAGNLELAGGPAAIDALTGGVPGVGGVRRYAQLIIEAWRWRQRLTSTWEQQAAIHAADEQAFEAALQQASNLVALAADESYVDPRALADHMWRWMEAKPDEGLPLPVEWPSLGRMLRLRAGHVTVLAGWSHQGKSIAALGLAASIGARGHKAVVWTNEDTPEEIVARHLCRATGVPAIAISDRRFTAEQASLLVPEFQRLPFGVQPCFGWDARQIGRHIRQVRPQLAVLDHFHALPNVGKVADVDEAIQTLVAAAGQTGCHLIVVCQLNQERLKQVVRPAPVARDLRGSGQLFNLAHNVVLVYRQEEEMTDSSGRALGRPEQLPEGHIDVVKNKAAGRLGAVAVRFDSKRLRFVEVAP